MNTHTALDPTEVLLIGVAAITLIVLIVSMIYRALTGHLRDDFMTPGEVRRTYFPTRQEAEEDAHHITTEAERRQNRRSWLILLAACVLIGALVLIVQHIGG